LEDFKVEVLSEVAELHHKEAHSEDVELHHKEAHSEDVELNQVETHLEQLNSEEVQPALVHHMEVLSAAVILVKVDFLDVIVVQMAMFLTIIMVKETIAMTITAKILHSVADPIIILEVVSDVIQEPVVSSAKPDYVDNKVNLVAIPVVDLVPVLSVDLVAILVVDLVAILVVDLVPVLVVDPELLTPDLLLVVLYDDHEN